MPKMQGAKQYCPPFPEGGPGWECPGGVAGGTHTDSYPELLSRLCQEALPVAGGCGILGGSLAGFKGSAFPFEEEYLQLISSVAETTNQITRCTS